MSEEIILSIISDLPINEKEKKRLVEATRGSFDPQRRPQFDCYRATAYVMGDLELLEVSEQGREYPGYKKLVRELQKSGRVCVPEPRGILDVAVIKTGYDAYHVGLVVNTRSPVRIWAKEGLREVKITGLEEFSGYRDGQGKVQFFTRQ